MTDKSRDARDTTLPMADRDTAHWLLARLGHAQPFRKHRRNLGAISMIAVKPD